MPHGVLKPLFRREPNIGGVHPFVKMLDRQSVGKSDTQYGAYKNCDVRVIANGRTTGVDRFCRLLGAASAWSFGRGHVLSGYCIRCLAYRREVCHWPVSSSRRHTPCAVAPLLLRNTLPNQKVQNRCRVFRSRSPTCSHFLPQIFYQVLGDGRPRTETPTGPLSQSSDHRRISAVRRS